MSEKISSTMRMKEVEEDDMTAFDITPLQIPVGDGSSAANAAAAVAQQQHLANMSTLQRAKYQKSC